MSRSRFYELGAFKAAARVSQFAPTRVRRGIGAALGRILFRCNADSRSALIANLQRVTGVEFDGLHNLCRQNAAAFGRMLADYFYSTGAEPGEIRQLVGDWQGFAHIEAARSRGKGTILITAHLGNWELGALILALDGLPMSIVTLEEPTAELTRWREDYRQRLGIKTIALGTDKFAFVEMMNRLRRNELVAMLVDRPPPGTGTPIRFFGEPTEFSSGPALLWQHTGAAVVPAFVIRNGDGKRYRSFIEPEIEMESRPDPDEAVAVNTQSIASRFESIIRQHPEQWFNYVPIWPSSPGGA